MTGIERAIELGRWDLVWMYLMVGVAEAASALPRESLDELIGLLAGEAESAPAGKPDFGAERGEGNAHAGSA